MSALTRFLIFGCVLVLGCGTPGSDQNRGVESLPTAAAAASRGANSSASPTTHHQPTPADTGPTVLRALLDSILPGSRVRRTIVPLRTRPGHFVVSQRFPTGEPWHGYRLALATVTDSGANLIATTPPLGDQEWLEPTVWELPGRIFVLADQGSEYSWGLFAYFITPDSVVQDTAFPALAKLYPEGTLGPSDDALPYTTVSSVGPSILVTINTDLVQDPGGRRMQAICRSNGGAILIAETSTGWSRRTGVAGPITEPMRIPSCS